MPNIVCKYSINQEVLVPRKYSDVSWMSYFDDGDFECLGIVFQIIIDKDGISYWLTFPKWYPDNFSQHEYIVMEEYIKEK